MKRSFRRLGLGAVAFALACFAQEVKLSGPGGLPGGGGGGGGGAGFTLTITPPTATIAVNATLQLALTLRDGQGAQVAIGTVTWTTSNAAVVAVDQNGQVRAVGLGSAIATASTAGTAANVTITVVSIPVASVVVTPSSATLQLGSTATFQAVARDAAGNALPGRAIFWSTSNAAVLTVDQAGVARAVATGTATLTATSEGRSGTASVTVQNIPVATVQVTPATDTVQIGQQTQLAATPRDASGNALTGRQVAWSSSASTIARVSGNGLIDGLAAGTATVTATSEGQSGTATITVIPVPVAVVIVVPQAVTVQVGATTTFNGTPRDINGNALTGRPISWASANTAIAQVSPTGVVSGIAPGTVLISATVEGVVGSAFVTVTTVPATLVSVTIAPQTAALLSGQTQQFTLTGTLSDASTVPVSGTFTAPGGSINGAGIYTAPDASGTFLVIGTATGTSLRDTATVTVTRPPVATVTVAPASATVDVGQTRVLTATMRDAGGNVLTNRTVSWASTNTTVATVSTSGLVTARAVGTATITATSEGQSGSSAITTRLTPVASVSITPSSAVIGIGLSTQLTATCRDAGGNVLTGRTVLWSTNAPLVATVSTNGTVTVIAVGTATITANCEGPTATATITGVVVPPSAGYPNEPPGAIVLMDYDTDFGSLSDPPWSYSAGAANLSTITDVTAPMNPNKVGRVRFTPGCCDGSGPAQLTTYSGPGRGSPPANWTRWYVADWIKFDPAFRPHGCCQKLFEFFWASGGDKWLIVKADPSVTGFPFVPRITTEFTGSPTENLGGRPLMLAGVWYQIEILIYKTGRVQMWVRPQGGTAESMYDGFPAGFGTPSSEFVFWWWGYGGNGAYSGPTAYMYHNHIRSSYTP